MCGRHFFGGVTALVPRWPPLASPSASAPPDAGRDSGRICENLELHFFIFVFWFAAGERGPPCTTMSVGRDAGVRKLTE
jgi:hypothetical protein